MVRIMQHELEPWRVLDVLSLSWQVGGITNKMLAMFHSNNWQSYFGMWWNEFYVRFHSMRGNAWGCEGIKDFTIFSSGCISLVTVGWVFFYPETVLMINFASKDFGLVMFWKGYYWYHFCQLGFTYFLLRSQVVTASSLTCLQLRLPWILSSSPSLMNHDHRKLSSIVGENIE
jgi:hypothetical protein